MANEILKSVSLRINFEAGLDEAGDVIEKRKTFSNIKNDATPDQLLSTAQTLAGLQVYPLGEVVRTNNSTLTL
jgi:hypothetical protein